MARKLQSQKNQTKRDNFNEKSGDSVRRLIDRINEGVSEQKLGAAKARSGQRSAGNTLILGDRSAPTAAYDPKKSDYERDADGNVTGYKAPRLADASLTKGLDIASGGLSGGAAGSKSDSGKPNTDAFNQAAKDAGKAGLDDFLAKAQAKAQSGEFAGPVGALLGGQAIGAAQLANKTPLGDLFQDLAQDTGKEGAAQNPAQWLLNFASTGLYATSRQAENLGAVASTAVKKAERGDVGGALGDAAVGAAVGGIAASARGISEGLGARYDGQKPRTMGQNLEAVGSKDAIRGAIGGITGKPADEAAVDTTQGVAGTVADIAGDPLTFLTVGVGAGVKGAAAAARGASAATREAAEVAGREASALSRIGAGIKATPQGFVSGMLGRQSEALGQAAIARENAAIRAAAGRDAAETATEDAAVATSRAAGTPEVADDLAAAEIRTEATNAQAVAAGEGVEVAARAAEPDPAIAATRTVLQDTQVPAKAAVPAKTILNAARQVATTQLDPTLKATVRALTTAETAVSRRGIEALRQTPEGAAILGRPVDLPNGMTGTVEKLVQMTRSAIARDADNAGDLGVVLDRVLEGPGGQGTFDAERFAQALRETGTRFRGVSGDDIPADQVEALLGKLDAAKTDKARLTLLGRELASTTTRQPGDVFDFIDEAVKGSIDEQTMRAMIKALGIQTRVRSNSKLAEVLNSTGRVRWQQIQDSIGTPDAVVADHGIRPEVIGDAAKLDIDAEVETAQQEASLFTEMAARLDAEDATTYLEIDPASIGRPGSALGQAIEDGSRKLGEIAAERGRKGDPSNYMDSSSSGFFVSTHRSLVQKLGYFALRTEGGKRNAFIADRYLTGLRALEAEARTLGFTPVIGTVTPRARPMFVSLGELSDSLGDDFFTEILFSPSLSRSSYKKEVANDAWRLSLFPNHLLNVTRYSRTARVQNLGSPEEKVAAIAKFLTRESTKKKQGGQYVNPYATTKEGRADIQRVAERLASDEVQQKLSFYHGKNEVRMSAFANAAAGQILQPLVARLQSALAAGATRSELAALIRDTSHDVLTATRNTYGQGDTLIRDLTKQRLDRGVLEGILGPEGVAQLRSDKVLANAAATGYESSSTFGRVAEAVKQAEFERDMADALRKVDDDLADFVDERAMNQLDEDIAANGNGLDEDEAVAYLSTRASMRLQMTRPGAMWEKFAYNTYGTYGQGTALRTAAGMKDEAQGTATQFAGQMAKWLSGQKGMKPLGARLGSARGTTPITGDALKSTLRDWWQQLSQVPPGQSMDEVRAVLIRGAERTAQFDTVRAVSPAEANLMVEFKRYIDAVFNEDGGGVFSTAGATARHVRQTQDQFGFRGTYDSFKIAADKPLAAQAGVWREFEFGEDVDPLTLLANYAGALSTASTYPRIAQQAAAHLGHIGKLSDDAAKGSGWKTIRPDPNRPDSIAAMIPRDVRFDEAAVRQLSYLDEFLQSSRIFNNAKIQEIATSYNQINFFIKALGTVWRLGHHVTSVLGEMGALLMDKVSPTQAVRGWRIVAQDIARRQPDIASALDALRPLDLNQAGQAAGGSPRVRDFTDTVQVATRGGNVRQYTSEEIINIARQYGVYITHEAIAEVDDLGREALKSKVRQAVGAPNQVVSKISAVRDNGTRMAHFIAVLEREQKASLDEAFLSAAARTNEFHPTWNGLSRTESKVISKVFFYYTWVKQMSALVIRETLDRPGLITMPSKLQYNMAQAAGLNPESIGMPFNQEEQQALPTYITRGVTAPVIGSMESGQALWSYSLGFPQMDALNTVFGGFEPSYGEPGYTQPLNATRNGVGDAVLGNLNPLIRGPYELASLESIDGSGRPVGSPSTVNADGEYVDQTEENRRWQWVWDNVGGSATGGLKGTGVYNDLFPKSDYGMEPAELEAYKKQERQRAWVNWLTGIRLTQVNSPGSLRSGEYQNGEIADKLAE